MWRTKTFRTREAMTAWLAKRGSRIQWEEIAINNAYGVLWRPVRLIRGL